MIKTPGMVMKRTTGYKAAPRIRLRKPARCRWKIAAMLVLPLGLLRAADGPGASALNLTPQEQAWLQQHPQIRVGLDPAWPPFSFYSRNNEMVGIDVDMLNILHQRLGTVFIIESGRNWSEVYAKAQNHDIDM